MTDSVRLALTLTATVIGSGVGTAIVGAMFKQHLDKQLENHKSLLLRNSRIHERQVDALLVIHSKLDHALFYFQRAASAGKLEGEADAEELLRRMGQELAAASEDYSQNKLLLSNSLSQRLDEFFSAVSSAGIDLKAALSPMISNGEGRAHLWTEAREAIYKRLPTILRSIQTEARATIHS